MSVDPAPTQPGAVEIPDPEWLTSLIENYQAAVHNVILLHGPGVHDYVSQPGQDLKEADLFTRPYLASRLALNFSVVCYSPDEGLTFPGSASKLENVRGAATATRARFERLAGLSSGSGPSEAEKAALRASGLSVDDLPPAELPKTPGEALEKLALFLRTANSGNDQEGLATGTIKAGRRAAVLVDRVDLIVPPCDKGTTTPERLKLLALLHRLGTDPSLPGNGSMLVLLAPGAEAVHQDLLTSTGGVLAIELAPPDIEARTAYVERMLAKKGLTLDDMTPAKLAGQMAGLGLRHIEDVALRAARRKDKPKLIDLDLVRARKRELVLAEYGGVLEVVEPTVRLADVGGHDRIKEWLQTWVFEPLASGDAELLEYVPVGCLLMGPAGTGKTLLARAIAAELGWPFIFLRAENTKGMWMGESEQKWAKAIRGSKAFGSAVIFFDEIDQKIRRGGAAGSSNSVDDNIFSRTLEWISEEGNQGKLLFLGATNEPQNVDAALKRPGRFGDGKLPLLPPDTAEERADVLLADLRRRKARSIPDTASLVKAMQPLANWTQAELGDLGRTALGLSKILKLPLGEAITKAATQMAPATADVRRMTDRALEECNNLELVPDKYRDRVAQPMAGPSAQVPDGPREGRDLTV